jgi:NAD(P)-dependent dehydrogenase (short-subunit alcohol dehydrogenase family)
MTLSPKKKVCLDPKQLLYDFSGRQTGTNLVHRHNARSCEELDAIDAQPPTKERLRLDNKETLFTCYPCGDRFRRLHPVYIYSCFDCGQRSMKMRYLTRDLAGNVALVTGARSKLGHQIVLKLLRAGSVVIGLTRFPARAVGLFANYSDAEKWHDRLHWIECDFDCDNLTPKIKVVMEDIEKRFGFISILVNNAAQTIRVREKQMQVPDLPREDSDPNTASKAPDNDHMALKNRYGDERSVPSLLQNSWQQTPENTEEKEYIECYRINALAPAVICQQALSLMRKSVLQPYIINVHAREGLMDVRKSPFHVQTNMAKAALHMLTKGLVLQKYRNDSGLLFCIHGCDPGWISVDEYYADALPFPCAPLDERDGAARILYPLFAKLHSCGTTRRHFFELKH